MLEMLEIVQKVGLLMGLFYFAWKDYKTKMVAILPLVLFGALGIGIRLLLGAFTWESLLASSLVGGFCLLVSLLTAESLGLGDALLFLGTGMYLEAQENFMLLCGALILAGGFAGICLLLKKKHRKDKIPMIPFVYVAYVLFLL